MDLFGDYIAAETGWGYFLGFIGTQFDKSFKILLERNLHCGHKKESLCH